MGPDQLSEYCHQVEDHLTKVNGGQLVRVVGPGFELVRRWAETGIPLSVVFRGIDLKADRHRLGQARRPLRIEFCEADVDDVYEHWRRAVGLPHASEPESDATPAADEGRKRASLTKHLDRAAERLARVTGRLDVPEPFLQTVGGVLDEVVRLRDRARGTRGEAREAIERQLGALDERLLVAARAAATPETLRGLTEDAARDLSPFRTRLDPSDWERAVHVTVDRLLRDLFGLPTITL